MLELSLDSEHFSLRNKLSRATLLEGQLNHFVRLIAQFLFGETFSAQCNPHGGGLHSYYGDRYHVQQFVLLFILL